MGAGTDTGDGTRGHFVVTDMGTIETSNPSCQLLIRGGNVGACKSVTARVTIRWFRPGCRTEAHICLVGEGKDRPFDNNHLTTGYNTVLNVLEHVKTQLFVDGWCVAHGIGLVDASTPGHKGDMQVVIPVVMEL